MKYDMKIEGEEAEKLQEAINGDTGALWRAFAWSDTPQGHQYWSSQADGASPLDIEALKEIQRQCVGEVGTLAELNVKEGDVVEYINGATEFIGTVLTIQSDGTAKGEDFGHFSPRLDDTFGRSYRIISRADAVVLDPPHTTPKTWGEMTDAEKGVLLLADHEGKVIQNWWRNEWVNTPPMWEDGFAYRIKPHEPVVGGKEMVVKPNKLGEYVTSHGGIDMATHHITFDTIDGKPDVNSVKMEEL